jgi:hypothetical protein
MGDMELRSREELLLKYKELRSALRRPREFVALVFQSDDEIWFDRCSSIVV